MSDATNTGGSGDENGTQPGGDGVDPAGTGAPAGAGDPTGGGDGQTHTGSAAEPGDGQQTPPEDETGKTFDYDYVKSLREESQGYRTQLREQQSTAETLRASLWATKLAAMGKLADPTDLPMPEGADPTDDDAMSAAVDDLLSRKPHLAARRARGDIGQHETPDSDGDSFSLLGTMQAHA